MSDVTPVGNALLNIGMSVVVMAVVFTILKWMFAEEIDRPMKKEAKEEPKVWTPKWMFAEEIDRPSTPSPTMKAMKAWQATAKLQAAFATLDKNHTTKSALNPKLTAMTAWHIVWMAVLEYKDNDDLPPGLCKRVFQVCANKLDPSAPNDLTLLQDPPPTTNNDPFEREFS